MIMTVMMMLDIQASGKCQSLPPLRQLKCIMAGVSDCLRCTNVTRNKIVNKRVNKRVKINKLDISNVNGEEHERGKETNSDTKNDLAIGHKGREKKGGVARLRGHGESSSQRHTDGMSGRLLI